MKNIALALLILLQITISPKLFSQNVAINSTGNMPDTSAMLDVSSNSKGFLAPRMTTAEQTAIVLPATGLAVFNTTLNAFQVNTGTPLSPIWSSLITSNTANAWSIGGNSVASAQNIGTITNFDFPFITNNTEKMRLTTGGNLGIGITPTAVLHLKAGTAAANTAPLKFTSGALLTTAAAGAVEFLTDKYFGTITTGAARKEFTLNETSLTSTRVPFTNASGRLTDLAAFTYVTNRLSPTYITLGAGTATAGTAPLVFTSGTILTVPIAGAVEYNGTHFYGTVGTTRYQLDQQPGTVYTGSNGITLSGTDFRNNLITGIAGGQTVVGGTAAGNSLTLSSTSNVTKGNIIFGTSAYDEVNNRLGLGNITPTEKLDVTGNVKFSGALMPNNLAGASGTFLKSNGAGTAPTWVTFDTTNIAVFSQKVRSLFSATAPVTYSDGLIGITQATTASDGYLSSTDWNTFNGKADTANTWRTGGNNVPGVQRIGTISNFDFPFITNNTERMRLSAGGNLGIGNTVIDGANAEKLLVDGGTTSYNVISGKGDLNSYLQLNIKNNNSGTSASSDVVATNDAGTEANGLNFIDMGVNSSGNTSTGVLGGANTTYLYSTGSDLSIGNAVTGKSLLLFTGGVASSNERMRIDGNGNVGIGNISPAEKLDLTGNLKFSGALMPGGAVGNAGEFLVSTGGGSPIWFNASPFVSTVAWVKAGNGGTSPGTDFLGTTDAQDMVFKTNNTERMRIVNGVSAGSGTAGDITLGDANSGTVRTSKELVMREDGDQYGPSILRLRNRTGENGAIFETIGASANLVDFIFKTGTAGSPIASNIRFETRPGSFIKVTGNTTEWQIGQPDLTNGGPTLIIGASGTGSNSALTIGNFGIGNSNPSQKLDVTGNIKFSGALMPNNLAGTAGNFLTSNGAGTAPTWVTFDTANIATFSQKVRSLFSGTAPITYSNGTIGITQAATASNGYLSSADWNTFNGKADTSNTWRIGGNSVASAQSIGTATNFDFPFITNNTEKMRLSAGGNLGIGATVVDGANAEKLLVDAGTNSYNVISGRGNNTGYLQLNIKNTNAGATASSDVVATNDTGTEANGLNYVDMGVNSSGNTSTGVLGGANTGYLYSTGSDFSIGNAIAGKNLLLFTGGTAAANERMRIDATGDVGIGVTVPTAVLHLKAGTIAINTAPLKFTSGSLMTTAEVGAVEFLTDKYYGSITTGTARKEFTLNDIALTSTRIPFANASGRLTDLAAFTYATNRLSPTYITLGAGTATAGTAPLVFTSGTILTVPIAGAVEYNGTHFYGTVGATRYQLDQQPGTVYTGSNGITLTGNDFRNNLITGIAGGQTVIGGTSSANSLTLTSTSHVVKGKIIFGTSAYDELNNRLGLGNSIPTEALDITGNLKFSGALMPNNLAGTAGNFLQSMGSGSAPVWVDANNYLWQLNGNPISSIKTLGTTTNFDLPFITNNIERMRIDNNGNVGIGTATPSTRLHVYGTNPLTLTGVQTGTATSADSVLTITSGLVQKLPVSTFATSVNSWSTTGNAGTTSATNFIGTTDSKSFRFRTNNIQRMKIDSANGNVAIGQDVFDATNPEKLVVNAGVTTSVNALVAKGSIDSYLQFNIKNQSTGANATTDIVATADNGTEATNYVDLGINGSNYTGGAIETGVANDGYLISAGNDFYLVNSTANKSMLFLTGGTGVANERMRILSNGRIGMGVQNPAAPLVVKDTVEIRRTGPLSQLLFTNTAGTGDFRIGGDGGDIFWQGGGGRALQMGSYWTTILGGDRQTSAYPAFVSTPAGTGVLVLGQRDASVPLAIQSNSGSQSANLTEWRNSSGTALSAITKDGYLGLGTSNPATTLSVTGTNPLTLTGVQTGTVTSADSVLTITNGLVKKLPVSTFATSANFWSIGGNSVASAQNIGTTTNFDFPFITNNTEKMRLSAGGNLGIGAAVVDGTNAEKLLVDAGTTSYNVISGKGNLNSYLQLNIKNSNAGIAASSDVVATNDLGTEANGLNFVDMGVNSSGNTSTGVLGGANTGYLYSTGSDFSIGNATASKNLLLFTGGTASANERMRIDGNGNVGIGNVSPAQKLDITGNLKFSGTLMPGGSAGTAGNFLQSMGSGSAPVWFDANNFAWQLNGNPVTTIKTLGNTTNFDLPFITNNVERMRLSAGGNLGIGTTVVDGTNAEKLLVDAGTTSYNVISGKGNLNSYLQLNIKNSNAGTTASSDVVATNDTGTEANGLNFVDMGVNSSGNTSTGVLGGANTGYLYSTGSDFSIGNATASKNLLLFTGGTASSNERMRIDGNGNVGIGSTLPGQKLDVSGNINAQGSVYIDGGTTNTGTPTPGLVLGGSSSGETISSKRTAGTNQYGIDFYTASTSRMTINNTGLVGLGTNIPTSTIDVKGSVSYAINTTTANTTLGVNDHTLIITGGTPTITLPAASTCTGREYTIVNQTGSGRTISSFIDFSGLTQTTIVNVNAITIQSNGTNWYRIQ